MLHVSIFSRWGMYLTPVTDIVVHYFMGKIQEVILKNVSFGIEKAKKKIFLVFVFVHI